jgi:hypothetical protein
MRMLAVLLVLIGAACGWYGFVEAANEIGPWRALGIGFPIMALLMWGMHALGSSGQPRR